MALSRANCALKENAYTAGYWNLACIAGVFWRIFAELDKPKRTVLISEHELNIDAGNWHASAMFLN